MKLISTKVDARSEQLVLHTGDIAADPSHLGGDVGFTLLSLRLQLYCLTEDKSTG